jgi:uncharacterized protein YjbI with pentapeptide repeats
MERVKLSGTILDNAVLHRAHLEFNFGAGVSFKNANLFEANLQGADFAGANLEGAILRGAKLEKTRLYQAKLGGADLREAELYNARCQQANFEGADLSGAHLEDATLEDATGLTDDQVAAAFGNSVTVLPDNIKRPSHWPTVYFPNG